MNYSNIYISLESFISNQNKLTKKNNEKKVEKNYLTKIKKVFILKNICKQMNHLKNKKKQLCPMTEFTFFFFFLFP